MADRRRAGGALAGLGAALAVSLPAALVAQILDAMRDDDLPATVTVPLALIVVLGAVVGGWFAVHRGASMLVAPAVGAIALALVGTLGLVRDSVSGGDSKAVVIPASMLAGAALGLLGATVGARRPGRTRT